jgi:hypothetical protein
MTIERFGPSEVNVTLTILDGEGNTLGTYKFHNRIVTAGLDHMATLLEDKSAVTEMGFMALGTSATATTPADTALGTEIGRVALVRSRVANVVKYTGTFPPGTATGTIEEAGIFNDVSVGDMLARLLTGSKVKPIDQSFIFEWEVTITDDGV